MCDQTHSLGLCKTDFVHSIELSPARSWRWRPLLEKGREREERGGEERGGEGRGGEGREGEGRGGKGRGGGREGREGGSRGRRGEGRGGVNKCLWESGHK